MPYHWTVRLQLTAVLLQLLLSLIAFDISKFSHRGLSSQHHHQIRPRNVHARTTPVLKICLFMGHNRKSLKFPLAVLQVVTNISVGLAASIFRSQYKYSEL